MQSVRSLLLSLCLVAGSLCLYACDAAHSAEPVSGVEVVGRSASSDDGLAVFSVVVQSVGGNRAVLATSAYLNEDNMISLGQTFRPPSEWGSTIELKGGGYHAEASLNGVSTWADVTQSSQIVWTVH